MAKRRDEITGADDLKSIFIEEWVKIDRDFLKRMTEAWRESEDVCLCSGKPF